jgi:hypothetical protein
MSGAELLIDGFGRVRDGVQRVVDGMTAAELAFRLDDEANTIGWLIWHLSRVQDDHIAAAGGLAQAWPSQWWEDSGVPFDPDETGYGQGSDEVAAVRITGELLTGYHDAVFEQTISFLTGLKDSDMAKVVDTRWNPPVTMAVRLVSVLSDDLQHLGQAEFIRGILERSR